MTDPQPEAKKRRGLVGFYVAMGVVALLLVGFYFAWTPLKMRYQETKAWRRQERAVNAVLQDMDKRTDINLKDVSAKKAQVSLVSLIGSHMVRASENIDLDAKITLQFKNTPMATILASWCRQTNADWTIAPDDSGLARRDEVLLVIADRGQIARLEDANPRIARLVRDYKQKLAAEASEVVNRRPER